MVLQTRSIPILLGNANYYGTLAAVRSLGNAGVKVETADPARVCHGRYSRYASGHLVCPSFHDTDAWVDWLLRIGRSGPRRAIYATSDAVSFALARHQSELSTVFDLYQPSLETIMSILDKGQLLQNAHAVGIDTPATWFPKSSDEAATIADGIGGQVLVKPRSQLIQRTMTKGIVTPGRGSDVKPVFDRYLRDACVESDFIRRNPDTAFPLIQRFYPQAIETVYSLTGFREKEHGRFVMRGAKKVLQFPRKIGVGLCFEPASVDPVLAERAARLCERIGYYGVFELEFIIVDQSAFLIDFNGRFYNQIAFDIARAMDLPAMAYAAAIGDHDALACLMRASDAEENAGVTGFCNRFALGTMVKIQRTMGKMSTQEAKQWQQWLDGPAEAIIDAVAHPDDPLPWYFDVAQQLLRAVRHPRAAVMQYAAK
jgi:D-aspartate ligase